MFPITNLYSIIFTILIRYDCSLAQKCIDLSKAWVKADDNELGQFTAKDIEEFSPLQTCQFFSFLLQEVTLNASF